MSQKLLDKLSNLTDYQMDVLTAMIENGELDKDTYSKIMSGDFDFSELDKPVEETPAGVSLKDRAIAKNFANDPSKGAAYLQKQYPQYKIYESDGRILIDQPGKARPRVLDPAGFNWSDLPADLLDIGYDVAAGAAEGLGALGGTALGGPVGGVAGAAGAGAGMEALRQKLGQALGIDQNMEPGSIALAGGVAGAIPAAGKALAPLGRGISNAGKAMYRSGLKTVDRAAIRAGKKLMPSEVLNQYGVSGTNKSILEQSQELVKNLGSTRRDLYKQAGDEGVSVNLRKALERAKPYLQKLADDPGGKKYGKEGLKLAGEYGNLLPEETLEKVTRLQADILSDAEGAGVKVDLQKALAPAKEYIAKLKKDPATEAAGKELDGMLRKYTKMKTVSPSTARELGKSLMQRAEETVGAGSKGMTRIARDIESGTKDTLSKFAPESSQALLELLSKKGRVPVSLASDFKSTLYDRAGNKAFQQFKDDTLGSEVFRKLGLSIKDGIEDAITSHDPALGQVLKQTNEEMGALLSVVKQMDHEAYKAALKNLVTPVDAITFSYDPAMTGLKKLTDLGKTTVFRTKGGRGLQRVGGGLQSAGDALTSNPWLIPAATGGMSVGRNQL